MTSKQNLVLSVSHNIFLTKEQRYNLIKGIPVEVIGVSVPVWYFKGITSEPGIEVFASYYLTNNEEDLPITETKKGYQINMPQIPGTWKPIKDSISNDEWRKLTPDQKESYYESIKEPISAKKLFDIDDGGSERLVFDQYNKFKKNKRFVDIVHFVTIKSIEKLEQSLI